jgi:hypothetical protein
MKSILFVTVLVLLSATVMAQDLSQLIGSIDKLESSLKGLVTAEQTKREEAIKKLQTDLDALKKQMLTAPSQPGVAGIPSGDAIAWKAETDKLTAANAELKKALAEQADKLAQIEARLEANQLAAVGQTQPNAQANPDYNTLLANLSTQLVELKSEVNRKRGYESQDIAVPGEVAVNLPNRQKWNGLQLSGYVNGAGLADLTQNKSEFSLERVAVDVVRTFHDQAVVQADLRYVDDGTGAFRFDLAQGFLAYKFGKSSWSALFGKFNAPMGFELPDPPEMNSYSHSLVYSYGQPVSVTGLQVAGVAFPVDWRVYLVNGWDINADNNSGKTVGGRIGFTPVEDLNFGFAAISGSEQYNGSSSRRTAVDCDFTYSYSTHWLLGFEFNQGFESSVLPDGKVGKWDGALLLTKYTFNENVALAGRFDYFNDQDGLRTGTAQRRLAFTVAPSLSIIDGLHGLLEMRWDRSDKKAFVGSNGELCSNKFGTALQFTYEF